MNLLLQWSKYQRSAPKAFFGGDAHKLSISSAFVTTSQDFGRFTEGFGKAGADSTSTAIVRMANEVEMEENVSIALPLFPEGHIGLCIRSLTTLH